MREVFKGVLFTNQKDILFHSFPIRLAVSLKLLKRMSSSERVCSHTSPSWCVFALYVCVFCVCVCATCLCSLAHWPVYFCNAKEHYCLVAADWVKHQSTGQKEPEALWARLASCLTTAHMSHTVSASHCPLQWHRNTYFPYSIKTGLV